MTPTASDENYDRIGTTYRLTRRPDPRLARRIRDSRGGSRSVVNVGAGTGSYEPTDRFVVAVVHAWAESLPFDDGYFDAGLAVLTLHHGSDAARGLRELTRVVPQTTALLTRDPASDGFLGAYRRLERDLSDGNWQRKNLAILEQSEIDLGYCLIVGTPRADKAEIDDT